MWYFFVLLMIAVTCTTLMRPLNFDTGGHGTRKQLTLLGGEISSLSAYSRRSIEMMTHQIKGPQTVQFLSHHLTIKIEFSAILP